MSNNAYTILYILYYIMSLVFQVRRLVHVTSIRTGCEFVIYYDEDQKQLYISIIELDTYKLVIII